MPPEEFYLIKIYLLIVLEIHPTKASAATTPPSTLQHVYCATAGVMKHYYFVNDVVMKIFQRNLVISFCSRVFISL